MAGALDTAASITFACCCCMLHAAAAIVATNTEMSPMFNEKYTSMIAAVATSP